MNHTMGKLKAGTAKSVASRKGMEKDGESCREVSVVGAGPSSSGYWRAYS